MPNSILASPDQVIAALESHGCNPKRSGVGWKAKCPAHDGKTQSLSVHDGDTGNAAVIHCFSGCEYRDVMHALGLNQANGAKRQVVTTYDYDGYFETVRYSPKGFAQRRKLASGDYAWNLNGVAVRLYRQNDLMAVKPSQVVVVEGEKDVDTLRGVRILAVTNHGGAGKWRKAHTAALVAAGVKAVVVVPDNDEPGHEHGNKVAAECKRAGLAVKWAALPAKDVTAYLGLNNQAALLALISSAADWTPPAQPEAIPKQASESAPPISEHVVALGFTDKYRETMRYSPALGCWFEWDKTRWKPDKLQRAYHYVRTLAGEAGKEKSTRKAAFARGVESFCRADPAHAVGAGYWDVDPWHLGTPSGTVDLKSGRVLAADPAHRITKLTAVEPGQAGECPRWLQFLSESTGGNNQLIAFLQRWFGYALTGSVQEQALTFFYGPGNNGKSVFLGVLAGVLGASQKTGKIVRQATGSGP